MSYRSFAPYLRQHAPPAKPGMCHRPRNLTILKRPCNKHKGLTMGKVFTHMTMPLDGFIEDPVLHEAGPEPPAPR